ncbi:uncharacterized protein RHOBADRAFT_54227 [Rhodotorula graminis WP1]|uniref:F-box domain-containing protein n=1 Tax=Rhodotorula graminis (strain WP1) TaxID=578459 RepID=A0A194S0Y6_RHOGW|nr:uncharacterized protein RHOBADRAFT_54227 [Rhodotorula graminis WP1]KPV74393.1 hypothetical protein RHOBADRAFT_54227 [Rhodotorula graminis WP1]
MIEPLSPATTPRDRTTTPPPPSLEVLPAAEHRAVRPWSRLPAELKHQIVDEVLQDVAHDSAEAERLDSALAVGFFEERDEREHAAKDGATRKRLELARLQAVVRDFRSICRPKLWQRVDLNPWRSDNLDVVLGAVPFVAPAVRRVDYKDIIASDHYLLDSLKYLEWQARALDALKRCTAVETLVLSETHGDLSGGALPRLRTLDLDKSNLSHADLAVLREQSALTSLSLAFWEIDGVSDGTIVDLVASMPGLRHLAVRCDSVAIKELLFVPAGLLIETRLESLELAVDTGNVDLAAVHAFLALFSSSLVKLSLELRGSALDWWPVLSSSSHIHLPHLTSFAVGADFTSAFFLHLDLPSLSFFRLDLFPALSDEPRDLVSFLKAHQATLERVHLSTDAISCELHVGGDYEGLELSDEAIGAIEGACEEIGCEVTSGDQGEEPDESESESEVCFCRACRRESLSDDGSEDW